MRSFSVRINSAVIYFDAFTLERICEGQDVNERCFP